VTSESLDDLELLAEGEDPCAVVVEDGQALHHQISTVDKGPAQCPQSTKRPVEKVQVRIGKGRQLGETPFIRTLLNSCPPKESNVKSTITDEEDVQGPTLTIGRGGNRHGTAPLRRRRREASAGSSLLTFLVCPRHRRGQVDDAVWRDNFESEKVAISEAG
jgi:hypothetical protein